jgi:RimJ/RimL family protein N-acetyltransferase
MMSGGVPLGPAVDTTPAAIPGPVKLEGRFGYVEQLDVARHRGGLWDAMRGHDHIWTYLPVGPHADESRFGEWLSAHAQDKNYHCYTILDVRGRALGVASLLEVRPAMRVIEIGYIVYSPALQRTALATEAQYLFARYAFETLGYRRYEWKCNALNAASRRAALRLGFTFEGIFRQHMIIKGRSRDTAWFSMLDGEWPARKAVFERWLAPENFGYDGMQNKRLSQCMS